MIDDGLRHVEHTITGFQQPIAQIVVLRTSKTCPSAEALVEGSYFLDRHAGQRHVAGTQYFDQDAALINSRSLIFDRGWHEPTRDFRLRGTHLSRHDGFRSGVDEGAHQYTEPIVMNVHVVVD